jgi:hypothetical protein
MKVLAALGAFLCLLLFAKPAEGENARLPYRELYKMQKAQIDLSRTYTNLALVLQMKSTLTNVAFSEIKASIDAKAGPIPIVIGSDGSFGIPMRDDLLAEDPWILVNQPKGTMQLNWHAGLAPWIVRQLTNAFHYGPLMRAVRDCDDVQETMRQFFPTAPRLTAVGLKLTFRATSINPAAIIHAKDGDRRVAADPLGELIIPIDADLLEDNPMMALTEIPLAVEIVTRKSESGP